MKHIIEDFPFTIILALIGLLVGFSLPSALDIFTNYDFSQASGNPAGFLTGWVIGFPIAATIHIFSGLIGGIFMGVVGLVIDIIKNTGGSPRL